MTELIKRLRLPHPSLDALHNEAADEIERLTERAERAEAERDRMIQAATDSANNALHFMAERDALRAAINEALPFCTTMAMNILSAAMKEQSND